MEIETITVSTSRKINHAIYGGEQFESSDHFCSMSATLEAGENPQDVHRDLMEAAKEMVGTSVANEVLKIQGGKPWAEFRALLRDYRLGKLELTDEEYQSWNRDQKAVYAEMQKLMRTVAKKTDTKKYNEK